MAIDSVRGTNLIRYIGQQEYIEEIQPDEIDEVEEEWEDDEE